MRGQTNKKIITGRLQRALRHAMTDAEQVLWRVLRKGQISGAKFRRQHPFDNYILDFVSLGIKLVIEVDGGQHGEQSEYDAIRTLEFIEAVKEKIWITVQELQKQPHPHPNPPLEGEGK
ncbi:MAG: DUF559 domain-containing protein [Smithella sp.]